MTHRHLLSSALLFASILMPATSAFADPGTPSALGSATFITAAAPRTSSDSTAISGGFSFVHFFGGTYYGFYGTFAHRVTGGEHPVAVVGQISFHHNGDFEENPTTFLGGAQATLMHDENLCISGRGMVGGSHWPGESNDLNFQFTGVVDIHMKQMKSVSFEVEAGVLLDRSEGFTGKGFIMNIGVMKTFGG